MNSYSVKLKHFAALMLMSLSILCYESTGSNKRKDLKISYTTESLWNTHTLENIQEKYNLVL
jgi:hypothetical protein